ncbi:hypothetical protein [Methylobacterium sp. Leaf87]|uniref:hypothetical protein n=1 Tax=Methylobacterium sp. Leaf87 TaxID=1736243 RepID=UPI000AD57A13|nr:hypothetical protein [Methylobacterium sp. Leaf87]
MLADLGDTYPALRPTTVATASSAQRALADLIGLLNAQALTFAVRDRVEGSLIWHHRFMQSDK